MAEYSNAVSRISLEELIIKLHEINAVKFGSFVLKSGLVSPVYIDLRVIVSYPEIMVRVSEYLWDAAKQGGAKFVSVCGVPYTALPLATCIAMSRSLPMLIRRKEAKDYGTRKLIEGHYTAGDICLVVEDVVTSGSSVLETAADLNDVGLRVNDVVVLLDREQGGKTKLEMNRIRLHSVLTINKILDVLESAGKVDPETVTEVKKYVADNRFDMMSMLKQASPNKTTKNQVSPSQTTANDAKRKSDGVQENGATSEKISKKCLRYSERAGQCKHSLTKCLFEIMEEKKTNIALSLDVTDTKQALQIADTVGPHICMVKTHVDILEDFSPAFTQKLTELADKHKFLIFEDRKYADIGNTVKHQYCGGIYHVSKWAHLVNAHTISGPGLITALKQVVGDDGNRACVLIAEMSSEGNLATGEYTKATIQMAEEHSDFVIGFICQRKLTDNPEFVHLTPGVRLDVGQDNLGQRYLTPETVISDNGSDVIIVGRGIIKAADPLAAAKLFQERGYAAYLKQVS